MPSGCNGCKYYYGINGATTTKCCNFYLDTGVLRGCPVDNCIHHTKRIKEEEPMSKAVTQDKIDEVRAMRAQGIPVAEIEKLTGVSHNSISKYTKDMKNPAAAATTAGTKDDENITYERLSDDIISSSYGNVKPHEETTGTLSESEDKPDTKSYEGSSETSADERIEGITAKNVPDAVREACLERIEHLRSEIEKEMVVVRDWEREIKELEAFIK